MSQQVYSIPEEAQYPYPEYCPACEKETSHKNVKVVLDSNEKTYSLYFIVECQVCCTQSSCGDNSPHNWSARNKNPQPV